MNVIATKGRSLSQTDHWGQPADTEVGGPENDHAASGLASDFYDGRSSPRQLNLPVIQACGCRLVEGVRSRWASSGYAALRNIFCRCDNGNLVIYGDVTSYFFKQMAQEVARTVDGVHRIENRLIVKDEDRNTQ